MTTDHVTDSVRFAGSLRRYHTWPTIQTQTVGEHSWQVAVIYEQIFGALNAGVERYIRLHDVAELVVGDIPLPVKAENPDLKVAFDAAEVEALKRMNVPPLPVLNDAMHARIKICDLLEMMLFGMTERELGSHLAVPIIVRTRQAARVHAQACLGHEDCLAVLGFINKAENRHEQVLGQISRLEDHLRKET